MSHVVWTRVTGRPAHVAFTVALDDEARHGLLAWLAAHGYAQDGATWSRGHHVIAFERADELGIDEATALVRPSSRRSLAHGTDAEGVALPDDVEVIATQIVEEVDAPPARARP